MAMVSLWENRHVDCVFINHWITSLFLITAVRPKEALSGSLDQSHFALHPVVFSFYQVQFTYWWQPGLVFLAQSFCTSVQWQIITILSQQQSNSHWISNFDVSNFTRTFPCAQEPDSPGPEENTMQRRMSRSLSRMIKYTPLEPFDTMSDPERVDDDDGALDASEMLNAHFTGTLQHVFNKSWCFQLN